MPALKPAPQKWWVINVPVGHATPYTVIQAPAKPELYAAGPFPTQAKAQEWITSKEQKFPQLPNPLSGIGAVGHWVGLAVEHLADGAMWRSLGWLLLGMILVIAGVYLWFRTSASYEQLQSAVLGTVKAL